MQTTECHSGAAGGLRDRGMSKIQLLPKLIKGVPSVDMESLALSSPEDASVEKHLLKSPCKRASSLFYVMKAQ